MQSDEVAKAEEQDAQRCKARLQHLQSVGAPSKDHAVEWNRQRLDRLLVDHLLRSGCMNTAVQLANEADVTVIF